MKYESELINEILEQRGHEFPDLHYQSECVETWIKEYRGAYPKLCDYEAEWLYYIVENPIGEFPYETVTTNNTATINNVVPFEYKSAMLKGNTIKDYKNNLFDNVLEKGTISISNGEPNNTNLRSYRSVNFIPINGNFKTAKYGIYGDLHVCFYDSNKSFISAKTYVLKQTTEGNAIVTPPTNCSFIKFYNVYDNNEPTGEFGFGVMAENEIIELEIQSVKMPVLTTTGKNLFELPQSDKMLKGSIGKYIKLNLKPNTNYTYNSILDKKGNTSEFDFYGWISNDINSNFTGHEVFHWKLNKTFSKTFNTGNDEWYFHVYGEQKGDDYRNYLINFQLEEGSTATSYEPYKSNILTVNEPIELRGIGDVRDELNLLTGEVVQNIGEIMLDGSESWNEYTSQELTNTRLFYCGVPTNSNINTSKFTMINNRFASLNPNSGGLWNTDVVGLGHGVVNNAFRLRVLKSTANTISELKEYLHSNPIVVQYELAEKSIKTVALTVVNQDGETLNKIKPIEGTMHINVSGTPLNPTAILEVPVEAITQNLASFIETEE